MKAFQTIFILIILQFLNFQNIATFNEDLDEHSSADCLLELDEGNGDCELPLKVPRYYYDGEMCSQFEFRGCNGNANRFKTQKECKKICRRLKDE
jgi:hypothetical protein